jgi:DNA-directed RNA polymerase beta subunit
MATLNPEQARGAQVVEDGIISEEDAFTVIKSYFTQHGLVSQQISSFDRFISFGIQEAVTDYNKDNVVKVAN